MLLSIGAVALILRLLFQAYRRSLHLVNPQQQLGMLRETVQKQLRRWDRRIGWMGLLVDNVADADTTIDHRRSAILRSNSGWDRQLRDSVNHAVAFARRAGDAGDQEVSAAALTTVVNLNRDYVRIKGRTFYGATPLLDNPLVTDGTINSTLESLRRLLDTAIARNDEPQTEQVFRAFLGLARVYAAIPYPEGNSLTHAALATGYLEGSVEAAVRHDMTDTTMNGLGALGEAANVFLSVGRPTEMAGVAKKIGFIGCAGALKEKSYPLTLIAVEQLSQLTITLLRVDNAEVRFAMRQVLESVSMVAKIFLELPDPPHRSTHSTYLAPFYSSTSLTSFRAQFTALVNAMLDAEAANEVARKIADNLAEWGDDIFVGQKELLLLAVEKRSQFAFDMVYWITGVSELLLCASRAPATRDHTREELEKHALWLFSTLSWIPRDLETARFVETFQVVEEVFKFALMSLGREWEDGFDSAWKWLLTWGVQAGRDHTGWGTLEHALSALAALALRPGRDGAEPLKAQLRLGLATAISPPPDIRIRTARDLREKAANLRHRELELRMVERVLATNDRDGTRQLLLDLADILEGVPLVPEPV